MKQFNIQQLVKRDGKWQWADIGVSFSDDEQAWDKVVSVVSDKKALEWINAARMAAKLEQQGDTRLAKKLASQGLGVKLNQSTKG